MVRVALPSYDIHTLRGGGGGVATFLLHFAKLLRENGDDVSIIATCNAEYSIKVDEPWRKKYDSWGIELIYVHNDPYTWHCGNHLITLSRKLAPTLEGFDIAYFMDWGNVAFQTVRAKRFTTRKMPVCVTVTHGASKWLRELDRTYPNASDLHLDFMERYSAEHSDFVVSPSRKLLDFIRNDGWKFKRDPEVLGLPFYPTEHAGVSPVGKDIKRLLFFGRVETRKNFQLFVKAIIRLSETSPGALRQIEEIVFLGSEKEDGAIRWIYDHLAPLNIKVVHLGDYDNVKARNYLASVAAETLAVIPSMYENLTYAGIEASLIPGLNLICTNGGGTPEVFGGKGENQLFSPTVEGLCAKILERLKFPLTPDQLISYDYKTANERWLDFHRRACELVQLPRTEVSISEATQTRSDRHTNERWHSPSKIDGEGHSVDVCVTYYNKQQYFGQLLRALENQTTSDFSVIAVDDGSPDPEAIAFFDAMEKKYTSRGWTFFRQENKFVDAARNAAARRSKAEYLLMIDADDVITPNGIERLLEAARISGDDCLVPASCRFIGDEYPFDENSGLITAPVEDKIMPIGPNLSAALLDPWILGGSMIFIRRAAFEGVGGYRELYGVNHEDWELLLTVAFSGYRLDVLPEFHYLYRQAANSLSRGADMYRASRRLIDVYNRHLAAIGLHSGGDMIFKLHKQSNSLEGRMTKLASQTRWPSLLWFEPTADSPIETNSEFYDELDRRFGKGDTGPRILKQLRSFYRRRLSLEKRLALHDKFMSLLGGR